MAPLRGPVPDDGAQRPRSALTVPDGIFITRLDHPAGARRLAVKDLFDTAGVRTTYGSSVFADYVPDRSAPAVVALEDGGWVVVGKTNLHEFAYGVTSQNPHYGTVPNPVAAGRLAGGSSGGSAAALAAGLADLALGSDSGGSIRIPAACCGVVGFKPTHGLVPADGCFPLAPSFDHVGPMARSVSECAAAMELLAPGFERASLSSLRDVRAGVAWLDTATAAVRARVEAAAACFGHNDHVGLPVVEEQASVFMREVADVHRELFAEHAELYGDDVRTKIERCLVVTDAQVEEDLAGRGAYRERLAEAAARFDVVLTPTLAFVAPPVGRSELEVRDAMVRLTYPFNLAGWPALALPCGPADDGLPASVQIVAPPGEDALLLAVGELVERELVG